MNAAPKLRWWRDVRWEERESGDTHQELGRELHAHAQRVSSSRPLRGCSSQQPLHSRSSRRDRDRRKFATHEHDNNASSDDDAQRPHDEPPKSDEPRGLGIGALHIFASDDDAATEIFVGNLIRPTDVLKVNDAAQFGAILRNSSDARPALSQIEKNGKQMFVPARRDVQTVCGTAGQRYDDDEARARLSRGQS